MSWCSNGAIVRKTAYRTPTTDANRRARRSVSLATSIDDTSVGRHGTTSHRSRIACRPGRTHSVRTTSSSHDEFEPGGDSSEVVLARILGDASGAEDAWDMCVLDVAAQRNPPVNAKFHTTDEKPADVRRIDVIARRSEGRRLFVRIPADAGAGKRRDARIAREDEPVSARDLER